MPESRNSMKKQRIRRFFLNFETSKKKKKHVEEIHEDIAEEGLCYIQMKLPLSKITEEFESKIKDKVEHNFLKAKIRDGDNFHYIPSPRPASQRFLEALNIEIPKILPKKEVKVDSKKKINNRK